MMRWPKTGLWRHPDFLKLWAAQAISAFGSRISRTALPIVALLTIDATPAQIGVLSAVSFAPGILVGLFCGGRVDRSAKRPLLIGADLFRAALLLTVPVAAWLDLLTMPQLFLVGAGVGAAHALFEIADNAYLPALVGKAHLVEGNAKLNVTEAVAEVGGPSLAGILIELVTAPGSILFDVISYLISAAFLGKIDAKELPRELSERPTFLGDLAVGFRASLGHPLVRPLFLVEANRAFFNGFFLALYMVFSIQTLGLAPGVVGVLIGLGGIGALGGALIAQRIASFMGLGPALIVLAGLGQAAGLLIPLARGPEWLMIASLAAHQLLGDGLLVAYLIHVTSLRQTVLPIEILGRANAMLYVATGLLLPAGALAAGWLATIIDVRSAVWIGVSGGLLAPLILLGSPVRSLRRMPVPE